jgi:hypothetical protein
MYRPHFLVFIIGDLYFVKRDLKGVLNYGDRNLERLPLPSPQWAEKGGQEKFSVAD